MPEVLPPRTLARRARLRHTTDDTPGLRRQRRGQGFQYVDARGRRVRDRSALERITALRIPPAWNEVWICPQPRGHLQATGRDARGRKQYLYHEAWQEQASRTKFTKLRAFGEALPALRRRVARHVALPKLTQQKVAATIVALLDETHARVGNEEYVRANGSFGLTTLRDRHARVNGAKLRLKFLGKSAQEHIIELHSPRVARIVRQCQDLPGQTLFQYRSDDGALRRLESTDVNRYLRSLTSHNFTAKDFRTWKATSFVLEKLCEHDAASLTASEARRAVTAAIRETAKLLGNTVTVCRNYYVHPQIVELFLNGELAAICSRVAARGGRGLDAAERMLLKVLGKLERNARPSRKKRRPK